MMNKNHPFAIWQSKDITEFLVEFYQRNFAKAGIDSELVQKMIWYVFDNKNKVKEEELRENVLKIFNKASRRAVNKITEPDLVDLTGVRKFLDIGANKLVTINYLADKYKQVEKFIAIDIIAQSRPFLFPEKGEYFQVGKDNFVEKIKDASIDFINVKFVLHHFKDLDEIKEALEMARRVLKKNGIFFLFEESFQNEERDFEKTKKLGFQIDDKLTNKFYNLSDVKKWEFIIANDWIINVSNPHMPWTGQYKPWDQWVNLLAQFGFELEEEWNLGLRANGRLKQGVHMIGKFIKR